MPEEIVRERWNRFMKLHSGDKEKTLQAVAESFGKSPLVMSYRLDELGIQWRENLEKECA